MKQMGIHIYYMFKQAFKLASEYTKPLIVSFHYSDGSVDTITGSYVMINKSGYFLTAAHLLESIKNNERKRRQRKIVNHSFWFGVNNVYAEQMLVIEEADLVVGKLTGVSRVSEEISNYPKFVENIDNASGQSLCKLGFPFIEMKSNFDSERGCFVVKPETWPIPCFPMECILTRYLTKENMQYMDFELKFIETSAPCLKGQSGGPIVDCDGNVWGIQSGTLHLPLGFAPRVEKNGKKIEENQFLNLGIGISSESINRILKEKNIKFDSVN